jgi:hypothetical protein
MLRAGFEPAIPVTKGPQTYILDRAATGIGSVKFTVLKERQGVNKKCLRIPDQELLGNEVELIK